MKHLLLIILTLFLSLSTASAQMDDWAYVEPPGAALEIRFPKGFTKKEEVLRISDDLALLMAEYSAKVTEGGGEKTYMIKIEQKIGSVFTGNMIAYALKADTERYRKMAESLKGKLISEAEINYNQYRGKDLYITYKKDKKNMGLRVRILFTDIARIYLVTNGPGETSYSYRSNMFFDNVKLIDGPSKVQGIFKDEWSDKTSPKNIFTFKTQTKRSSYIKSINDFKEEENTEYASIVFKDPILGHEFTYGVKTYILDKAPTTNDIKLLITKDYLSKYIPNASTDHLKTEIVTLENYKLISTKLGVPTSDKYPFVNFLIFEAYVKDNIVVIQDLSGPGGMIGSPLGLSLLSSFKFHPEKMGQPVIEQSITSPTAPIAAPATPAPAPADAETKSVAPVDNTPPATPAPAPPASPPQ